MSFENAIAGLGQLQQSFQNIAERRQREKLQLEEQEWRSAEAEKTRGFEEEMTKAKIAGSIAESKIKVGPEYARLAFAKEKEARDIAAGTKIAESVEGIGLPATPEQVRVTELLKTGRVETPVDTIALMNSELQNAFISGDPVRIDNAKKRMQQYDSYNYYRAYNDTKIKQQAIQDVKKEFVEEEISYKDLAYTADKVLRSIDVLKDYRLLGEGDNEKEDGGEALLTYLSKEYGGANKIPQHTLDQMRYGIANQLAAENPMLGKAGIGPNGETVVAPNDSAYRLANQVFDLIMRRGLKGFLQTYSLGEGKTTENWGSGKIKIDVNSYLEYDKKQAQTEQFKKKYIRTKEKTVDETSAQDRINKLRSLY